MQKARRRPQASTACRHTVSGSFSLPYSGFFSPFPHGTSSLSVSQEYLALPDGSGGFRQDSTCPALLRILLSFTNYFVYGTITLYGRPFQTFSTIIVIKCCSPTTPYMPKHTWFGLFPLRSPLLRKSLLFSLPTPTQMFQFSAFAYFYDTSSMYQVSPFGYVRINRYLLLPVPFRSLSRPSSPLRAQASPVCPY